ncbi:MAG: twin-arginine translocation signal domain-containing protein, partial [Deltaproteobacteria bacterium]|nr:twin-arginine translocation signal domain-containing protein [Deltaproteobacteria bacterium]
MERKIITRRDFLRGAGGTAVAAALGSRVLNEAQAESTAKVVLIRHAEVLGSDEKVRGEILQSMLDEAMKTLLETNKPLEAWKKLIKSSDVVGIKSNEWQKLPTPKELEVAIKRRVLDVGVAEKNIDVADRGVLNNPIFLNATALI